MILPTFLHFPNTEKEVDGTSSASIQRYLCSSESPAFRNQSHELKSGFRASGRKLVAVLQVREFGVSRQDDTGVLNFRFERFIQAARMCRNQPTPKVPGGMDESVDLSRDR